MKFLWLTYICLLVCTQLFVGCVPGKSGSGKIIEENRKVENFKIISISTPGNIYINQGDKESLKIVTDDNLLQYIKTEVNNNHLKIESEEQIDVYTKLNYYVTVKDLSRLNVFGSHHVFGQSPLKIDNFSLNTNGTVTVDLEIYCKKIIHNSNGLAKTNFKGKVDTYELKISGNSKYKSFGLEIQNLYVNLNGNADLDVTVKKRLEANINGNGKIVYKGDPIVKSKINGASEIHKFGEN